MTLPIAAAGFAQMAWELACKRTFTPSFLNHPFPRDWVHGANNMPDTEYYRIVDKAASFALPLMPNEIPGCRLVTL